MNQIQNNRWNKLQVTTFCLVVFMFLVDGIDIQILSLVLPTLANDWGIEASSFSVAIASGFTGSAFGAALGGVSGDVIGRRMTVALSMFILGVATIAMPFSPDISTLTFIRFFAGIGMGACVPPAMALLSDTLPEKHLSVAISMSLVSAPIGISAAGVLAAILLPNYGWKLPLTICGILPLILAALMLILLPSEKNKTDNSNNNTPVKKLAFTELLHKDIRWKLAAICGCFFMVYCTMSTALSWLPTLFSTHGFSTTVSSLIPSIWSTAGILATLSAGWLIARYGSRFMANAFILLGIAGSLGLVVIPTPDSASGDSIWPTYAFLTMAGCSLSAIIASLYTHTAQGLPSAIRSTGLGIGVTAGRIGGIAGAFTGAYAIELNSFSGYFAVIAALLFAALILFQVERFGVKSADFN